MRWLLVLGRFIYFLLIGSLLILAVGILYFSPGSRMLGLSVESADGANLSTIRYLWRLALKYLWLVFGILVFLPLTMRPLSEGLALLISTTGPPIFFTAFVFYWVGGPGRSVYDLAAGTVIVRTHPVDVEKFGKTLIILWIPVTLQVMVLIFLLEHFWGHPWDVPEYEVEAWEERRIRQYAETLTNYSLNVLGLTALTYAVFGWRHRPGRRSSPGGVAPARRDELVYGQVQAMSDSPTGTESLAANGLVLRRILATGTNLAMVSTSILVGAILINLIVHLIAVADYRYFTRSIRFTNFFVFAASIILFVVFAACIVVVLKFFRSNSACRILGLSVRSADGGDLSTIRYSWRMVLKYLWVLLGVFVCLPPFMRPVSEGLALLASTPGLPILLAGLALWWVGGSGRSVYDLGAGTVVVQSRPVDHARLRKAWLILGIPVILQIAALFYTFVLGQSLGFPWDIREYGYRVSARDVWRNKPFAEELTEYSLAILAVTGISYMVLGRRHRPGGRVKPAAGEEAAPGEGAESGGAQREDPSQLPFNPQS